MYEQIMRELREKLAALAHEQWSDWMKYMFKKGVLYDPDGTWTMPAWAVERWMRQMKTPYAELPEEEKENDRAEANRALAVLKPVINAIIDLDRRTIQ